MDLMSRRQLTKEACSRYRQATKKQKIKILDEFVANTHYHRKYALALLHSRVPQHLSTGRRRKRVYTPEVIDALTFIWKVSRYSGSHRLHPFLPDMVAVLEHHDELRLMPTTRQLLLQISPATMDRLLKPARRAMVPHGRTTTKPGTLLKKSIPIRTWADWDDLKPGFLEIDLVAHCAESTEGKYLETLDCVDVATGWCECIVPRNQGQQAIFDALIEIRQRCPLPLLGIDSDNDGAFINQHLKRYCDDEKIMFTRSRPYKKNDQAHVEGKNWTVVRQYVGYARYEGDAARLDLNMLYKDLRLYVNFFQPMMKLKEKTRVDGKVKKLYDTAQTPFQRVLASTTVSDDIKQKLRELYVTLNPVKLLADIQANLDHLWQIHATRQRPE
jgi:Integrase core domain.